MDQLPDKILQHQAALRARIEDIEAIKRALGWYELRDACERIATKPDYTNPEEMVRVARAALAKAKELER